MTTPERTTADTAGPDRAGETLATLEEAYAKTKRVSRELRLSDRIKTDLGIDSLGIVEILLILEERFGVTLVDNPRAAQVVTVGDLVALLTELRTEVVS